MSGMELPLVVFTVLGQAAVGIVLLSAVRQWAGHPGSEGNLRAEWIVAGALLFLAFVASLFHLGHPTGAFRTLVHLRTSWLSREVLLFGIFGILILAVLWGVLRGAFSGVLTALAALAGVLALWVSAMVYAPPAFPALHNGLPIVFFLLTAVLVGSSGAVYFAPPEKEALLVRILGSALVVGLMLYLVVPWVWLSGGTVMRMTGEAYYASALYWIRLAVGFLLPILVLALSRRIPLWLPVVILAGEVMGRILFFSHVVHSAVNLGTPY